MWFDNLIKTREELLVYFEDLLVTEGVNAAVRDLEVIFEAERWRNWYQGISSISEDHKGTTLGHKSRHMPHITPHDDIHSFVGNSAT